ncbi:hypothetical protein EYD45_05255 [Hyunsoonleella flava]|uniref:Uncharacterized protein n=1 Tax=Hyunsoonleella flava TaxID=2527939 RepID=A0A4Q9FE78_9FLAO|nr:hypothetical protein [Hyunsoonleella flava]TBN04671.1 hypothetical protein EYD45_05255 [Hyunsoonleella flava]
MKTILRNLFFLGMFVILTSCGGSKSYSSVENRSSKSSSSKAYYEESSGLSMEDAVVIHASGSMQGIPLEYEFVGKKEGQRGIDWGLVQQSLVHEGNKSYDVLVIKVFKTNEEKTYFFDITNFFGKL